MDWIVGYGPPPDKFLEKLQKSLAGTDTYKSLTAACAKDPKNVELIFKLAQKCGSRYTDEMRAKSKDLYQSIVTLDPEGKAGTYTFDYIKATVSYTQAAEFELGQMTAFGRKPDPAPLKAFIAKYSGSPLQKEAYSYLTNYYQYTATKDDADKFFDEYTAKYPNDASVLNFYVQRIIKDKAPVDRGIELAEKVKEITGYPRNPEYTQNLAQLYMLKGDTAKADEEYGKDFIDSYVWNTVYALTGYANFWLEQHKNLDSVEAMADLAVKMAPPSGSQWYLLQQVAGVYSKLDKTAKATATFGPDFAKKNWNDQNVLASYASFWNREGKNLESAEQAARRSVELAPDYYNNYTLAQILFKAKKYPEALKSAEKAVELVKPMAVKYQYPTAQYETLVKQIKDAMAKEKGGEPKK